VQAATKTTRIGRNSSRTHFRGHRMPLLYHSVTYSRVMCSSVMCHVRQTT
jgi:hypothetical protein